LLDHVIYAAPDLARAVDEFHRGLDPEQDVLAIQRLFALDVSSTPRFISWCARAARPLAETVAVAREAGLDLGEILPMSRTRPDGGVIAWTMTSPFADRAGGVLPFYIALIHHQNDDGH
jgi:hypothetical protein